MLQAASSVKRTLSRSLTNPQRQDVRIRVTFPGRVISQQHGTLDGQTVTWTLPPGEQTAIEAVAEGGVGQADGFPMGPAIGALLAVTLAALVLAVGRRSGTPG